MNITYKYVKKKIFKDDRKKAKNIWPAEVRYFLLLAEHYQNKIMKYCGVVNYDSIMDYYCVRKMPLNQKALKSIMICRGYYDQDFRFCKNTHRDEDECMRCWTQVLENYANYCDEKTVLPSFLSGNKKHVPTRQSLKATPNQKRKSFL